MKAFCLIDKKTGVVLAFWRIRGLAVAMQTRMTRRFGDFYAVVEKDL